LNGQPGVKSARYAGENSNAKLNTEKLLNAMIDIENRTARFRTIISLIIDSKEYRFEGICEGRIAEKECGTNGFGYDAVFIPDGSDKHFAEMSMEEKNKFSHRKKAMFLLIDFLKKYYAEN
jgi:XTP/dITP diphosphohydrolase